jgi:nitroimidazol reductase NimA-like FMN-containing flavoprotein (pyridoxamine 5'-phosphate oxidase superfamily)
MDVSAPATDDGRMTSDPAATTLVLNEHDCWELLRTREVGRLALVIDERPEIFPVNYVVDHGTIVFRTAEGTKLAAVELGAAAAFEVDGEVATDAWSVVIKGRAVEIEQMYELFEVLDLPLYPWSVAPKHRFVRIVPEEVSGRRFRIADRAAHHPGEPPRRRGAVE